MTDIDELKKILEKHNERISKLENMLQPSGPKTKKTKSKNPSIMKLILDAKEEGFFNKPQFRSDIVAKFEEMGYIYSGNSLDNPLQRSLKSKILGRKKINNKWGYVRR
ncbi:MAG: hypothetical protein WD717_01265 [Nitrosarchaeum sp.]